MLTCDSFYGARPIPLPAIEQQLPTIVIDNASSVEPPSPRSMPGLLRQMDMHSVASNALPGNCHPMPASTEFPHQPSAALNNSISMFQPSMPEILAPIGIRQAPSYLTSILPFTLTHSTFFQAPLSLPQQISVEYGRLPAHQSQYGVDLVPLSSALPIWFLAPPVSHDLIPRPPNPHAAQLLHVVSSPTPTISGECEQTRIDDPLYGSYPVPLPNVESFVDDRANLGGFSENWAEGLQSGHVKGITVSGASITQYRRLPDVTSMAAGLPHKKTLIVSGTEDLRLLDPNRGGHMQDAAQQCDLAINPFAE